MIFPSFKVFLFGSFRSTIPGFGEVDDVDVTNEEGLSSCAHISDVNEVKINP